MWQVGTFIGAFLLNKTFEMVQQLKHYNTQQKGRRDGLGPFLCTSTTTSACGGTQGAFIKKTILGGMKQNKNTNTKKN
jgi:hypothetical protein